MAVDTDGDNLSDTFERHRYGTDAEDPDSDDDGEDDGHEHATGMDPNNGNSSFKARCMEPAACGGEVLVISWPSVEGKTYRIESAPDLMSGFGPVATGIAATPTMNSYTVSVNGVEGRIYRVGVEQ